MNLISKYPKEHYQNLKLFLDGYGVLSNEQFDTNRSFWENKYTDECATENGFILSYSNDYAAGGDNYHLVFPTFGDDVFYFRYNLIKQWDIIENSEIGSEVELPDYKISKEAEELEKAVDRFVEESQSSEELNDSLNHLCKDLKGIHGIQSIQEYLTETFADESVEDKELDGIFWEENGKWKCNQWQHFQAWLHTMRMILLDRSM
ncbi:hypothetical protein [Leptospira paudalimensis]|uniref:Uncharacterized protein n=1 Tax=Leptospira paudalimensis TaxID=2950024 RepID=A0ABT3MCP1_9LEPT|nr:hypothetical protein [Leptospira paudalimensis]MCW7506125.1 hypothetical protein [Leptospira paudalimensis]